MCIGIFVKSLNLVMDLCMDTYDILKKKPLIFIIKTNQNEKIIKFTISKFHFIIFQQVYN